MGDIAIRTNIDEVFAQMDAFVSALESKVKARSANELIRQAKVVGLRKIAEIYKIGPRKLDKDDKYMDLIEARDGEFRASIVSKGAGLPLSLFNPRPSKVQKRGRKPGTGITVTIKGRNVFIPHAFVARMPSGRIGVFARGAYGGKGLGRATGKVFGRYRFGADRLPINELYTFGMAETLSNEEVTEAMLDRVEEQAGTVIKRNIDAIRRGF